ncbi:serine/threonine-protein kinase pim-3-like [Tachysurus fulvidraco]|uniref:serine/threonine-protein kinase pim-3-like n=1 Tax=Tachysurus fulvidraco TaxID=1234273 RepID=UPI000F4D723B|nr:serine/threonine-protein kinase pim-3-like [Tachysurus fulvidraco]XP_047659048.1 serine/threonine-protein kinase pim-3-like [Tachysurus fulvidraco]XP_047659049.1 serine/threonine-protein kinase pim-3-like [Tachysurus fulvidraco]
MENPSSTKSSLSVEDNSEASCSFTTGENDENPRKRKAVDEEPEPQAEEPPAKKRTKTETKFEKRLAKSRPEGRVNPFRLVKHYIIGEMLGNGSFGNVYAADRKSDGKKVAIKCVLKKVLDYITLPGSNDILPLEVALLNLVCKPPRCPYVISLLEWFETPADVIYILERPDNCTDLYKYCQKLQYRMPEAHVKQIMQQVVQATCHCKDRGVFHRDIQLSNVLLNTQTLEVKLTDFGLGCLRQGFLYSDCRVIYPSRWISLNESMQELSIVKQLGYFLHCLSGGKWCPGKLIFSKNLSEACCSLIKWCLDKEPGKRPTLEQLLTHEWF